MAPETLADPETDPTATYAVEPALARRLTSLVVCAPRPQTVLTHTPMTGAPLAALPMSTVEDVDGNVFLDCAAGIAVNSTGHSHPAVVKAIVDQAQKFLHMSGTDFYYEPQVKLAEELASIAPIQGGVR